MKLSGFWSHGEASEQHPAVVHWLLHASTASASLTGAQPNHGEGRSGSVFAGLLDVLDVLVIPRNHDPVRANGAIAADLVRGFEGLGPDPSR